MLNLFIQMAEQGIVPGPLVRFGIRRLCEVRLDSLSQVDRVDPQASLKYVQMLRSSSVAVATNVANEQQYEVPADFFSKCLGPHLKYSSAYWPEGCGSLAEAEHQALQITMARAEIVNGMNILELGCGWGSLTLALAEKFPSSKITAVSNSASQRTYILTQAALRNLTNVDVLTRDVSSLEHIGPKDGHYDRVVSVEMFEHLRNYEVLFGRVRRWLKPEGKLFVHIFTHKKYAYLFESEGDDNWMGKYFFTGGQMPSHVLLKSFQKDMKLEREWAWDGTHYQKTAEAWLKNLESNKKDVMLLFEQIYGKKEAVGWFNRWRIFYLAVAELFGYRAGAEWGISHYLFSRAELR